MLRVSLGGGRIQKALDRDAGSKGNPGIERLAYSVSVEEQFGVWSYIRDNMPLVCCRVIFDQGRQPGIYEKVVIFHPSGNAENDISRENLGRHGQFPGSRPGDYLVITQIDAYAESITVHVFLEAGDHASADAECLGGCKGADE